MNAVATAKKLPSVVTLRAYRAYMGETARTMSHKALAASDARYKKLEEACARRGLTINDLDDYEILEPARVGQSASVRMKPSVEFRL